MRSPAILETKKKRSIPELLKIFLHDLKKDRKSPPGLHMKVKQKLKKRLIINRSLNYEWPFQFFPVALGRES
jgi:hypothetical protein